MNGSPKKAQELTHLVIDFVRVQPVLNFLVKRGNLLDRAPFARNLGDLGLEDASLGPGLHSTGVEQQYVVFAGVSRKGLDVRLPGGARSRPTTAIVDPDEAYGIASKLNATERTGRR